jgi:hypothetical protein
MKLILFLVAIVLALYCNGQTNIDGLGILKLGSRENDIISTLEKEYKRVRIATTFEDLIKLKDKNIYFLVPSKDQHFLSFRVYESPQAHYYMIKELHLGEIVIHNLIVGFYDSLLFSIITRDDTKYLIEGITSKYGEPKKVHITDTVKCSYTYTGATFQKITNDFHSIFRNDDSIECKAFIGEYYDDKCERGVISDFKLLNKKVSKIVYNLSVEYRNKIQKDRENNNKKIYDKF